MATRCGAIRATRRSGSHSTLTKNARVPLHQQAVYEARRQVETCGVLPRASTAEVACRGRPVLRAPQQLRHDRRGSSTSASSVTVSNPMVGGSSTRTARRRSPVRGPRDLGECRSPVPRAAPLTPPFRRAASQASPARIARPRDLEIIRSAPSLNRTRSPSPRQCRVVVAIPCASGARAPPIRRNACALRPVQVRHAGWCARIISSWPSFRVSSSGRGAIAPPCIAASATTRPMTCCVTRARACPCTAMIRSRRHRLEAFRHRVLALASARRPTPPRAHREPAARGLCPQPRTGPHATIASIAAQPARRS